MEYTPDEHYDMRLTLCTGNSRCGTRARIYAPRYRTLMYLDECCRVSVTHGNTVLVNTGYRLLADCAYVSHWWCHNCNCGTRAVFKRTRYRTRIRTVPAEGPLSASWRLIELIPLLAQRTPVSRQSSSVFIVQVPVRRQWFDHGCIVAFVSHVSRKLIVSGHVCLAFSTYFLTGNHTVESLFTDLFSVDNFARINVFLSMKSLCFTMGCPVRKSELPSTSNAILQVASVEETRDRQRQFNCYRNILLPLDASLSTLFATTVQII